MSDAEYIASLLTEQQHLFPHRTIRATIRQVASQCGLSEELAEETIQAICADGQRAAGRLSRASILDLSRRLASTAARPDAPGLMVPQSQGIRAA